MPGRTGRSSRGPAAAMGACALAAALGACGTSGGLPPLSSFVPGTPGSDGGSTPNLAPDSGPPPCVVGGSDGVVCACADELTVSDPPTIYFVLDRSGSMAESGKWVTIIGVIGQLVADLGPRAKVGAAVFPDRSAGSCVPGGEVFPPLQGTAPAGYFGATAHSLTETLQSIAPNGGTPTAATLTAITPYLQSLGRNTFVVLATDGAPNCNLNASCGAADCQVNIAGQCDQGGNCCLGKGPNQSCNDTDPTLAAIRALAAPQSDAGSPADAAAVVDDAALDADAADGDGGASDEGGGDAGAPAPSGPPAIPVYVVGVPGSEIYRQILVDMAIAGGTARTEADAAALYYEVSSTDQSAFAAALGAVAAKITGSCTLELDADPDAGAVNVFFDGTPVPQTTADGGTAWTVDGTTVTVLGDACDSIRNGRVLDVRVVVGCPTVIR